MTRLPQLLVESSFCLLIFYAFYYVALRRETFFQVNRLYLLLMPLAALVIPATNISLGAGGEASVLGPVPAAVYPLLEESIALEEFLWTPAAEEKRRLTIGQLVFICYLTGVIFLFYRLSISLYRLYREIARRPVRRVEKYLLVPNSNFPASSFFGFVFWQGRDLSPEQRLIWEHEKVHIRQWHSLDVLLMEMWVIAQWFNPLVYYFRRSLRETHEFIADRYVATQLGSRIDYALYLADFNGQSQPVPLLNNFAQLLKKRLLMLARNKSRHWRSAKYLLVLPLFVSLMMLFSFDLVEDLPAPVSESFQEAEDYLERVGNRELPGRASEVTSADSIVYKVRWADKVCDCRPGQLPNYFHCENRSFKVSDFRRIARNGGFALLKNGQQVDYQELQVQSRRALNIKSVKTLFDFQNVFDSKAPFWKKVKKGDVLKFTFLTSEETAFHFDLTINDQSQSFAHAYDVYVGDIWIPIDMTSKIGVKYLTYEEFRAGLEKPIRLVKNIDEEVAIRSLESGQVNISVDEEQFRSRKAGDIPNLRIARPGDRKSLSIVSADGQKMTVSIKIRDNDEEAEKEDVPELRWGDLTAKSRFPVLMLTEEAVHQLAESPILLKNTAGPIELSDIGSVSLNRSPSDGEDVRNVRFQPRDLITECRVENYASDRSCLNEILTQAREGDQIILATIRTAAMTPFSIIIHVANAEKVREYEHFAPFQEKGLDNRPGGYVLRGINLTEKNFRRFAAFRDLDGGPPVVRIDEGFIEGKEAVTLLNNLHAYEIRMISFLPKSSAKHYFSRLEKDYVGSLFFIHRKENDLIRRYTVESIENAENGGQSLKFEDLGREFYVMVNDQKKGVLSGRELKDLIVGLKASSGVRKVEILEASPKVVAMYGEDARDGIVIITTEEND